MNRKECPYCGSHDTERVHIEEFTDGFETTRICNDCPAEFVNNLWVSSKDLSAEVYQCEQCGELVNEYDATIQTEQGDDETITLAFCKECSEE